MALCPLRKERDSNPRTREDQRFSRPPHSTTLPSFRICRPNNLLQGATKIRPYFKICNPLSRYFAAEASFSAFSCSVRQSQKWNCSLARSCEKMKKVQTTLVQASPAPSYIIASTSIRLRFCSSTWARSVTCPAEMRTGFIYFTSIREVTPAVWNLREITQPQISSASVACTPPWSVSTHPCTLSLGCHSTTTSSPSSKNSIWSPIGLWGAQPKQLYPSSPIYGLISLSIII